MKSNERVAVSCFSAATRLLLLFALCCCGFSEVRAFIDNFQDLDEDPLYQLRHFKRQQQQQLGTVDSAADVNKRKTKSESSDSSSSDCSDSDDSDEKSACQRCIDWYNEDRRDTSWLFQLNRDIPCPCKTSTSTTTGHVPLNTLNGYWTVDPVCSRYGRPSCSTYHPGADGCLLSVRKTSTGARQQCCYNSLGRLLGPTLDGAGTPDRYSDPDKHKKLDVEPFEWCCVKCKTSGYCLYYRLLRRGKTPRC